MVELRTGASCTVLRIPFGIQFDEVFRSIVAARRGQKPDEIQTRLGKDIATK